MARKKQTPPTPLAANLKRLMAERDVGVRQLAKLCGTTHASVNDWLNGANPTQFAAISKAASFFGTSMEFLLTGNEPIRTKNVSTVLNELFKEVGRYSGYAKFDLTLLSVAEKPDAPDDVIVSKKPSED